MRLFLTISVFFIVAHFQSCPSDKNCHDKEPAEKPNKELNTIVDQQKEDTQPKDTEPFHRTVARLNNPTIREFVSYLERNEPLIITGAMKQWGTSEKEWSDENLEKLCGHRNITVRVMETGEKVFQRGSYVTEKIKFSDFLRLYKDPNEKKFYYAAGIVLHKDLPELLPLVFEPKYLKRYPQANQLSPRMYFGQGGQRLHIHYDAVENLLHVIEGSKDIVLFDPFQSRTVLYLPDPKVTKESFNWSPIDMANEGEWVHKYPLFKYALPTKVTVKAGEILYLPPYWFHSVESSVERSLSINYWYNGDKNKFSFLDEIVFGSDGASERKSQAGEK